MKSLLKMVWFVFPVLALTLVLSVRASEEGAVAFSSFTFQSTNVETGPIAISGTQGPAGITALTVKAFKRDFIFSRTQLENLRGMIVNGVQLSSEGGYPNLGGRKLYLKLSTGFVSGIASGKIVVINERGDISFQPIKSK